MLRVALTGGIASGKTTVSNAFLALGVPVVDADILARQAVAIDSLGLRKVTDRFGLEILQNDGSLDRAKLREIIFSDSSARADLESIVHPEVRRLTNELINTVDDAKKILNSQASRDDRLAIADDVITNNGDISDINKQVNDLHDALLKLANTPKS